MLQGKDATAKASGYRPDIDGLRAVAVLLVLVYHAFPTLCPGGFIGVDVFFVISGFLITGIILNSLRKDSFSLKIFFLRRIVRLFPVLLLMLSTLLFIGWFVLMPAEYMQLGRNTAGGVIYLANFFQWLDSGYFDVAAEMKPLMHLWSLGIEEQFYLIWPVILWLAFSRSPRVQAWLLLLLAVLSFGTNVWWIKSKPDTVFYFPFFRFWELLIGAGLAFWFFRRLHRPNGRCPPIFEAKTANLMSGLGLGIILAVSYSVNKYSLFPGWWALLPTFGAAAIIAAGSDAAVNRYLLSQRLVVGIGLISYPLYLWHWPLISIFHMTVGEWPYHLDRIIAVIASFILAWASYRFVEFPIRHAQNMKRQAAVLFSLSVVVGVFGWAVYEFKGIPSRLPKEVLDMPKALQDMIDPSFTPNVATEWRNERCFLPKGNGPDKFLSECTELVRKPTVYVWGDSHAAALYPGLLELQKTREFGIIQRTTSLCPPVVSWEKSPNPSCKDVNDANLAEVLRINPDIVLLEAQWIAGDYQFSGLAPTLERLRGANIRKVVVLGPPPSWSRVVAKNIVAYFQQFGRLPPTHTDFGLMDAKETMAMDARLREECQSGVCSFESLLDVLCNERGCMLMTSLNVHGVTSYDQGHLSPSASRFVVKTLEPKIFGKQRVE